MTSCLRLPVCFSTYRAPSVKESALKEKKFAPRGGGCPGEQILSSYNRPFLEGELKRF